MYVVQVVRLFTQHIAIMQIYSHGVSLQKSRRVSAEKPTQPNQLDQTISLSLCLSLARARARSLSLSLSHTQVLAGKTQPVAFWPTLWS